MKRIVFIGDSFTEAVGIKYEDSFVGVLDGKISDKYEVINMGLSSYAPSAFYKKLEYWIENGLVIDQVIVMLDHSDIEDEIFHYRDNQEIIVKRKSLSLRPIAVNNIVPLENKSSILRDIINEYQYIKDSEWIEQFDVNSQLLNYSSWIMSKLTYSYIIRKIKYLLYFKIGQENDLKVKEKIKYRPENNVRGLYLIDKNIYYKRGAKTGLLKMAYKMDQIKKLLDKNNIQMKIGIYPWPSELLYAKNNSLWQKFWNRYSKLSRIEIIDTYPAIVNYSESAETTIRDLYIPGDYHFNVKGHKRIGNSIFENIKNSL